ncbi:MAG: hypothetical protein AAGM38_01995, partial [Pseudomonadota bacterium]
APRALSSHWATPITVEGALLALALDAATGDALWLLRREDGTVERWRVERRRLTVEFREVALSTPLEIAVSADLRRFTYVNAQGSLARVDAALRAPRPPAAVEPAMGRRWGAAPAPPPPAEPVSTVARVFPHPSAAAPPGALELAPLIGAPGLEDAPPIFSVSTLREAPRLTLRCDGARAADLRFSPDGASAALWDDQGRLAVIDIPRARIRWASVSLEDVKEAAPRRA